MTTTRRKPRHPPRVPPETLTLAEVAARLGVSAEHARRQANQGSLPGVIRLGRRLLFARAAIDALLGVGPAAARPEAAR